MCSAQTVEPSCRARERATGSAAYEPARSPSNERMFFSVTRDPTLALFMGFLPPHAHGIWSAALAVTSDYDRLSDSSEKIEARKKLNFSARH